MVEEKVTGISGSTGIEVKDRILGNIEVKEKYILMTSV